MSPSTWRLVARFHRERRPGWSELTNYSKRNGRAGFLSNNSGCDSHYFERPIQNEARRNVAAASPRCAKELLADHLPHGQLKLGTPLFTLKVSLYSRSLPGADQWETEKRRRVRVYLQLKSLRRCARLDDDRGGERRVFWSH